MKRAETLALWRQAAAFDPTLQIRAADVSPLSRKRIRPEAFRRERLFRRMASGDISLFTGLGVPIRGNASHTHGRRLLAAIRRTVGGESVKVRLGPRARPRNITAGDLVDRWEAQRGLVNITDFHIRDTALERVIDTKGLSDFNIFVGSPESISWHEMLTLVVSAAGAVTDSHSDDPDGSNHCFEGSKLWLVWETEEGRTNGLQDVERDRVQGRARFEMPTFLRLKSARWLIISRGMTLFLPGEYTHKVVTLEPYLGIGSFYVSLPNCLRTVSRWLLRGSLWADADDVTTTRQVADAAAGAIQRATIAPRHVRERLGHDFLGESVRRWNTHFRSGRSYLLQDPAFAALLAKARGEELRHS